MDIDLRPKAIDMSLCMQNFCPNKCKRYYMNWQPNQYSQSYILPALNYTKNGGIKPCKSRMD